MRKIRRILASLIIGKDLEIANRCFILVVDKTNKQFVFESEIHGRYWQIEAKKIENLT